MKTNRWKTAFFVLLGALLITIIGALFCCYIMVDQGVSYTHLKDSCNDYSEDLYTLKEIINQTDYTKPTIQNQLQNHNYFKNIDFQKDTIPLKTINLIFEKDALKKIQ